MKKLLKILMTAMMLCLLIATTAFAQEVTTELDFTSDPIPTGTGFAWDASTSTLTIHEEGLTINTEIGHGLVLPADATIVLNGDLNITTKAKDTYGINVASGTLTIKGTGNLTIEVSGDRSRGINVESGALTIEGINNLNVKSTNTSGGAAIYASGDINIQDVENVDLFAEGRHDAVLNADGDWIMPPLGALYSRASIDVTCNYLTAEARSAAVISSTRETSSDVSNNITFHIKNNLVIKHYGGMSAISLGGGSTKTSGEMNITVDGDMSIIHQLNDTGSTSVAFYVNGANRNFSLIINGTGTIKTDTPTRLSKGIKSSGTTTIGGTGSLTFDAIDSIESKKTLTFQDSITATTAGLFWSYEGVIVGEDTTVNGCVRVMTTGVSDSYTIYGNYIPISQSGLPTNFDPIILQTFSFSKGASITIGEMFGSDTKLNLSPYNSIDYTNAVFFTNSDELYVKFPDDYPFEWNRGNIGTIENGTVSIEGSHINLDEQYFYFGPSGLPLSITFEAGYEALEVTANDVVVPYPYVVYHQGESATIEINVTSKKTPYTIQIVQEGEGTISSEDITLYYGENTEEITFTPAEGYLISDVLVDDVSIGSVTSYKFENVTASHTLKVIFDMIVVEPTPEEELPPEEEPTPNVQIPSNNNATTDTTVVKTGDASNATMFFVLAMSSMLGLVIAVRLRKYSK